MPRGFPTRVVRVPVGTLALLDEVAEGLGVSRWVALEVVLEFERRRLGLAPNPDKL